MNFPLGYFPSVRCRRLLLLAGMVATLSLFAACGKKGPLYLPDDAASASGKTGGQVTAPAPVQPPK
jgi:predicted small lipoprotein YifL